ncbi:MAG: NAD(P)H-dependent oxidoreductase, partial [Clostridiales bacterium]|nr:NAD(P)H-dependent oxidoreductase [Clostridiales bacterium]
MSYSIGILVGSLRKDSFSKKIALAISKKLPEDFEGKLIDISRLALFNQDLEAEPPQEWLDFREEVKSSDGVLFVTPEYNRSIPAVLKNALDVASRPYGQGAWQGKPGAIASSSPGKIGGFGASQHLRQAAVCVGLEVMGSPEFYLGGVHEILDGNGDVSGAYA